MKPIKGIKHKEAHVAPTKYGMGDYYGTGIRNPIGRSIDVFGENEGKPKNLGKPPKSLA